MNPLNEAGRDSERVLQQGELTALGRIRSASNATFLCEAELDGALLHCVYKPISGEAPLWDFPDGTLAGRELAAYLVSAALGWNLVPHTIIREGPAGPGMVQRWVDQPGDVFPVATLAQNALSETEPAPGPDLVDLVPASRVPAGYLPILRAYDHKGDEVVLVHADDARLHRLAVFDVLINNADRKGGHVLAGADGQVYGVDHGVSLHAEDKLRTVLWGWAGKPIDDEVLGAVAGLRDTLHDSLAAELAPHLTRPEIAALQARVVELLDNPIMPTPDRHRPIPWPAF
ncbi:SCO1664 family protein [Mycolicibacterium sp. HS_4_1]